MQALPGQETPDGVPSFKLVLVGDGGTGALPDHRTIGTACMRLNSILCIIPVCVAHLSCLVVSINCHALVAARALHQDRFGSLGSLSAEDLPTLLLR